MIIVDYVHDDFTIYHNGFLRRFLKEELRYVEGQVLEAYEGWLGKERVRNVNARVTSVLDFKKILLPRDDLLTYGIVPKTWIVFSASRVGDPRRDVYYPIYPGKNVVYMPARDVVSARLEDLMLRMTGLSSIYAGLIVKGYGVLKEIKESRREAKVKK